MIQPMQIQFTQRMRWAQLPAGLRAQVETLLGSPVLGAQSQNGGFSPGCADRLLTEDGSGYFIKAADRTQHETAAKLHRREASIAQLLPASVPAATLIGHLSWQGWETLIFTEVQGRCPQLPWQPAQLLRVLDALADCAADLPASVAGALPKLDEELRADFFGFARMQQDGFEPADRWLADHLRPLHQLAMAGIESLAGTQLVHSDVRADNLLVGADGEIVLVDWPWASVGNAWYDGLTLLLDAKLHSPQANVQHYFDTHRLFQSAAAEAIDSVLAGLAGFYADAARRSPVPGLPTLRSYHQHQAAAATAWLRERLEGKAPGA